MTDAVEVMARAMGASKAWPVVFEAGSAVALSQAALSALDAAGFAVVPKEPTKAMRDAAMHHLLNTGNIYTREGEETIVVETYVTKAVYRAMLSAAQVNP